MIGAMTGFPLAEMLFGPLIPSTVNAMATDADRATYMAAISVTNDIKDTLGPATGAALFALAAWLAWLGGMAGAVFAAAGLAAAVSRKRTS